MDDFEKAAKKAAKKPEKKKNKAELTEIYTTLQSEQVNRLLTIFNDGNGDFSQELADAVRTYKKLENAYSAIYTNTPQLVEEEQLDLFLEQTKHDFFDRGKTLVSQDTKEGYIRALDYLGLVKSLDPNYKEIVTLYNKAEANATYNILIDYDMGNFPEQERLMREVLNDVNMSLSNYNTERRTFYVIASPRDDYQLTYLFTFKYLDLGNITKKNDNKTYERRVNGQTKRAQVTFENFSRNSKVSGVFTIVNNITGETIEKDQFNFNYDTRGTNTIISGDLDAIDPITLQQLQRQRSSEVDIENQSIEEFKRRMEQLLERHLRYNYTSGNS